jgi:IS30 family transposase
MGYVQLSRDERVEIAVLRREGATLSAIGRKLGRSKATISRELRRNWDRTSYRPARADEKCRWRRRRVRRKPHFSKADFALVIREMRRELSPEQASRHLRDLGLLTISHETIYRYVWRDLEQGGMLWKLLRQRGKKRRKRYGAKDSRGKLAGKRLIDQRPAEANDRLCVGHWEIDIVLGRGSTDCVVTLVDRKSRYVFIGKLAARTVEEVNRVVIEFIRRHPGRVKTITADNGTEFHGYEEIEEATGVKFYFSHPYHSWERGTSENTNGLIRQYLPKGMSLRLVTQADCNHIALRLNNRPRKILKFRTPESRFKTRTSVALGA